MHRGVDGVRLEDLVAGQPQAFVAVHVQALLSLVTDPAATAIRSETVPETLLFDVARLARLRIEFDRIARGVTLLTMVKHALTFGEGVTVPAPKRALVMAELAERVVVEASSSTRGDFGTIVTVEFPRMLDAAQLFVGDGATRTRVIAALTKGLTDRDEPVRRIM